MPLPRHTVLDFEIGEYTERRNILLESVVYSRIYFHPINAQALSDQHGKFIKKKIKNEIPSALKGCIHIFWGKEGITTYEQFIPLSY